MPVPVFNPLQNQSITSAMVNLTQATADVATSETTTSTTYADLATSGPSVSPASGVTQDMLLQLMTNGSHNTTNSRTRVSFNVNAAGASDNDASLNSHGVGNNMQHNAHMLVASYGSGNATKLQYKVVDAGTGTFVLRRVTAVAV